jgi:hypothetical protein
MPSVLRSLRVIGFHPVIPTEQEFREAVTVQWGDDLSVEKLRRAEDSVREHFASLFLIEIETEPADADVNWSAITQPIEGQPRPNWQAPYDERQLHEPQGRWAFFLHALDRSGPLQTQLGDQKLPEPSPIPPHLQWIHYEVPG